MSVLGFARMYLASGFSVVPVAVDGTKKPLVAWKEYQSRLATDAELVNWFEGDGKAGIALVHGKISGNSEVLDFESQGAFDEFALLVADHGAASLLQYATIVETPTGGYHVYYRSQHDVPGNQKLAWFADKTIKIETRGEGGYTIAPGSPWACHQANKPYQMANPKDVGVFKPSHLSTDNVAFFRAMACACSEYVEPEHLVSHKPSKASKAPGTSVGDDYNDRGEILPLLLKHGWQVAGTRSGPNGGVTDLTRSGKATSLGISATLGYVAPNVLYAFSSNAMPFDSGKAYPPFSVYGLLEHGGDFVAATKALVAQGFGEVVPPSVKLSIEKYAPAYKSEWVPDEGEEEKPKAKPDAIKKESFLPFTDLGNAERLVRMWGQDIRHSPSYGWLVWDGTRWMVDDSGAIMRLAKSTVRSILEESLKANAAALQATGEAERKEYADLAEKLLAHARKSEAERSLNAMVSLAKSEPGVHVAIKDLDKNHFLVNCKNGTLDISTMELREHRREDGITKIIEVNYNPDAKCPEWEKFLAKVQPDKPIYDYLQILSGYALTGDTRDQSVYFLFGEGQNGKSTYLRTIKAIMGPYAKQANSELLIAKHGQSMVRDDIASLAGARFVATIEVDDGAIMAEGLVKQLSGGEDITARHLYKSEFTFEPTFKIFLAANHKPVVKGQDFAIWRRIKLIPWHIRITSQEKDEGLYDRLLLEQEGIFAWQVRGAKVWVDNGCKIIAPPEVLAQTEDYKAESDVFGTFIADKCQLDKMAETSATVLFEEYARWCEERHERPRTMSAFGRSLADRGFEKIKKTKGAFYIGIKLASDDDIDEGIFGEVELKL